MEFESRHGEQDTLRQSLEARLKAVDEQAGKSVAAQREADERGQLAAQATAEVERAREALVHERAALARDERAVEAARRRLAADEARALAVEQTAELELASLKTTAEMFEAKELSIAQERSVLDERARELTLEQERSVTLAERAVAEQERNEAMAASQLAAMQEAATEGHVLAQAKAALASESRAATLVHHRQAQESAAQQRKAEEFARITRALEERVALIERRERDSRAQRADINAAKLKIEATHAAQREQVELIQDHIAANVQRDEVSRAETERVARLHGECERLAEATARTEAALQRREDVLTRRGGEVDALRATTEAQLREVADSRGALSREEAAVAAKAEQLAAAHAELELEVRDAAARRRSAFELEQGAADGEAEVLALKGKLARLEGTLRLSLPLTFRASPSHNLTRSPPTSLNRSIMAQSGCARRTQRARARRSGRLRVAHQLARGGCQKRACAPARVPRRADPRRRDERGVRCPDARGRGASRPHSRSRSRSRYRVLVITPSLARTRSCYSPTPHSLPPSHPPPHAASALFPLPSPVCLPPDAHRNEKRSV